MRLNDDKISSSELGIFIFLSIVGIGILALPSQLAHSVNNDAWILAILSGLINLVSLFIMCKIGVRYSNLGFVGTLRFLFGKVLGTILAIPVALYALILTALELRLFAEITKLYLLHKTPLEAIILPIILLTVVLVRSGIEPISRSFGIFLPVVLFILFILIIFSIQNSHITNLFPVFSNPAKNYIEGVSSSIFAYSGFEIMLVIFPFLREPKKAFKSSAIAVICVIILYATVAIQSIARLGTEETKALIYPVMALTKAISIPGGFIEDVEGLLSSLWVFYAFTSLVAFVFFFSIVSSGVFKHRKPKHFASLCMPLVYLLSLQGDSIPEVFRLSDISTKYFGSYTIVVLPILMLIASAFRTRKAKNNS